MSRAAGKVRKSKALVQGVFHPPYLKMLIPAKQASPAPPLGPTLGKPDRSYNLTISHPSSMHLLRLAAGVSKGTSVSSEVCGRLTLKHIYHIAQMKQADPALYTYSLRHICKFLINTSHMLGIEIVSEQDHTIQSYDEFIRERQAFLQQKKEASEALKRAKMLRL